MKDHNIELPPLPAELRKEFIRRTSYISEVDRDTRAAFVDEIARAAIEAAQIQREDYINDDRDALRAEIVALRGTIADLEADRQRRGEPVAYGVLAANTGLMCQLELAEDYEDAGLDQMRPEHVVPLYAAPQPAEPVKVPSDELAALDLEYDDYVHCTDCGYVGLVRLGQDECPACGEESLQDEPKPDTLPVTPQEEEEWRRRERQ